MWEFVNPAHGKIWMWQFHVCGFSNVLTLNFGAEPFQSMFVIKLFVDMYDNNSEPGAGRSKEINFKFLFKYSKNSKYSVLSRIAYFCDIKNLVLSRYIQNQTSSNLYIFRHCLLPN